MMVGIVQARFSSSRLPGKVLAPILGQPMLARQIERVRRARRIDRLVVATSDDTTDDPVADLANDLEVPCFRGSLDDVLDRFIGAARAYAASDVVRLTGDCPLADPKLIDAVIATYRGSGADYASNTNPPTYPDGLDVEVVSMAALERAWRQSTTLSEREHVTLHIHQRPTEFRLVNHAGQGDLSSLRWTVDAPEDLAFVRAVYEALYRTKRDFGTADILALLARQPDLGRGNSHIGRNEGLAKSLAAEKGDR